MLFARKTVQISGYAS